MTEIECDICDENVPKTATIYGLEQQWAVGGFNVACQNCLINIIGANISKERLKRLRDR